MIQSLPQPSVRKKTSPLFFHSIYHNPANTLKPAKTTIPLMPNLEAAEVSTTEAEGAALIALEAEEAT